MTLNSSLTRVSLHCLRCSWGHPWLLTHRCWAGIWQCRGLLSVEDKCRVTHPTFGMWCCKVSADMQGPPSPNFLCVRAGSPCSCGMEAAGYRLLQSQIHLKSRSDSECAAHLWSAVWVAFYCFNWGALLAFLLIDNRHVSGLTNHLLKGGREGEDGKTTSILN